jgi:hypothetical protein
MSGNRRPDPAARLLSHMIVGATAGAIVGKRTGPGGALLSALVAVVAHEQLDAPVADILADLGL